MTLITRRHRALLVVLALVATLSVVPPTSTSTAVAADLADPAPSARVRACDGLRNQTGITDSSLTISVISDISGPAPGLHVSSQQAVKAFTEYFNASTATGICGRRLALKMLDSRTDAGDDRAATVRACRSSFAAVGSLSAFDNGGAAAAQECGLPDLRVRAISAQRRSCPSCFAVHPQGDRFAAAIPDRVVDDQGAAAKKVAQLWLDQAEGASYARRERKAWKRRGVDYVYTRGIGVADLDYSLVVRAIKNSGAEIVRFVNASPGYAAKLADAMQANGYTPRAYLLDDENYGRTYLERAGSTARQVHSQVFLDSTPFEEKAVNPELRRYLTWLRRVSPGAEPTTEGLFAWSAARLFVTTAIALGGDLTRASLVEALGQVDAWTGEGLHSPQDVAGRTASRCWRQVRATREGWTAAGGRRYRCGPLVAG